MADIIEFKMGAPTDVIDSVDMLHAIAKQNPRFAFVISWPEDGGSPTYHSTTRDSSMILLELNRFIHKYYNGDFY